MVASLASQINFSWITGIEIMQDDWWMDNEDIIRFRDELDKLSGGEKPIDYGLMEKIRAEREQAEREKNEADIKRLKQLEERDSAVAGNMHWREEKLNAIAAKNNNTLFSERRGLPPGRIVATDKISPYPCSDQHTRELEQEHFRDEMRTMVNGIAAAIDALQEQINRIERLLQHV